MFSARSASLARAIAPRATRIRTYAAAAQSTKLPVALFGVDGTYASALYTASAKTSDLESTDKSLQTLKQLLDEHVKVVKILSTPTLSPADKSFIVDLISKLVPGDQAVKNLLEALADNNRLSLLGGITDKFAVLMSANRGEVETVVTSSSPLENKILSRLQGVISKSQYVGPGKKVHVVNKVNPDIIGGLVVEIGDRTIDLSISSKVAKMNKLLTDDL
jgi:F-type H+-transporting ATPase subunit O